MATITINAGARVWYGSVTMTTDDTPEACAAHCALLAKLLDGMPPRCAGKAERSPKGKPQALNADGATMLSFLTANPAIKTAALLAQHPNASPTIRWLMKNGYVHYDPKDGGSYTILRSA